MGKIKLLVLDVLKPHNPSLIDFTSAIADLEGIDGVDSTIVEMDKKVETVKVTVEGDIDFPRLKETIERMAGSIHSIDKVSAGDKLIKEVFTPQDK